MAFSKKSIIYIITFRYSMGKDGPTFSGGPTFPKERGSYYVFLYKPMEFVIFQGAGIQAPSPPPLDPRVASLTGFVHPSSWPKDIA